MPARPGLTRLTRPKPAVLLAGGVLLLAGCGATPPQLPVVEANRVSSALTGIAEACGEARQHGASRSEERPAGTIEAAARMRSTELSKVFAAYPERIYQSDTLREVVAQTVSYLRECGLGGAATQLERR